MDLSTPNENSNQNGVEKHISDKGNFFNNTSDVVMNSHPRRNVFGSSTQKKSQKQSSNSVSMEQQMQAIMFQMNQMKEEQQKSKKQQEQLMNSMNMENQKIIQNLKNENAQLKKPSKAEQLLKVTNQKLVSEMRQFKTKSRFGGRMKSVKHYCYLSRISFGCDRIYKNHKAGKESIHSKSLKLRQLARAAIDKDIEKLRVHRYEKVDIETNKRYEKEVITFQSELIEQNNKNRKAWKTEFTQFVF